MAQQLSKGVRAALSSLSLTGRAQPGLAGAGQERWSFETDWDMEQSEEAGEKGRRERESLCAVSTHSKESLFHAEALVWLLMTLRATALCLRASRWGNVEGAG